MLFNSLTFIVFFAVVLLLHHTLRSWRAQKAALLVASYVFYAAWNPPFVLLLWLSTAIDWLAARGIAATERPGRRRALLLVSLCSNLGLLAAFKYGGFLLENFTALAGLAGVAFQPPALDLVLPVGISFYTFQTLSYTLDVYQRRARPSDSPLDFALYVTFFPQLVAGPIVRATDFLPQCELPRRATGAQLGWGLFLMTLGLFQKVVLADALLAPTADAVFGFDRGPLHALDAWAGVLAFSGQIFCDFAGYSTCAIGAALCLGFVLPDNFRQPYAAVGFSDFWRRWHISLSTWLRDYLYIPLGGNRTGSLRTSANLMITMLLGGLWHGASWTFVAWGGLHGLYLIVERALQRRLAHLAWTGLRPVRLALGALTFVLVCVTWVFFRAKTFGGAALLLGAMSGAIGGGAQVLPTLDLVLTGGVVGGLLCAHALLRERGLADAVQRAPAALVLVAWTLMLFALLVTQGGSNAFIYFQF